MNATRVARRSSSRRETTPKAKKPIRARKPTQIRNDEAAASTAPPYQRKIIGLFVETQENASGSDLTRGAKLYRLIANAVIALVRHGVIALVVEDRDRNTRRERLAFGGVGTPMGAEGALADRQVSGVADNRELDWCHLPLLVPDVLFCLEQGVFNSRRLHKGNIDASF
jgi:hypothetical protein